MWKILCVLALYGLYSVQCVRITPLQSVFTMAEGSELQVNCSSRASVEWKKDGNTLPSGSGRAIIKATVNDNGDNISTLTLPQLETSDAGTYRCADSMGDSSFQLQVFKVKTREVEYEHLKDVSLPCSVENTTYEYTYTWKKGDTPVKEIKVEGKQGYEELENGTLLIKHPPRSFAGVYTCVATYTEPGSSAQKTINIDVNYYATPKVIPFDKSKNLVQDEELVIECRVLGHPKPSVTWFKEGTEIKEGEGRYTLKTANTYNGEPMENAELRLKSVDFDDGGTYTCMATQDKWPQFNSTQGILVRVKDKLAALWPFLGIVAEVVILCTIIFIYEKKRNKDAAEDEDPNQDGATPEKKSEGVRHRGSANNPRA